MRDVQQYLASTRELGCKAKHETALLKRRANFEHLEFVWAISADQGMQAMNW